MADQGKADQNGRRKGGRDELHRKHRGVPRHLSVEKDENGHAKVPDHYRYRETQLGKWVGKQRQNFKRGLLEVERIDLLEKLPGWVWTAR